MRYGLIRLLSSIVIAGLAITVTPAFADDSSDIRAAISAQLQAFRTKDPDAAYFYAAPNIKRMFPTPGGFMDMVQRGYGSVYSSQNATFGPMKQEGPRFRQEVFLSDNNGASWIASYTLERQPDGSMKITGVQIRKGDDVSA